MLLWALSGGFIGSSSQRDNDSETIEKDDHGLTSDYPELVPLLGEIRDQLKRIADMLETGTLNIEIGEPVVRVRRKRKDQKGIRTGPWE